MSTLEAHEWAVRMRQAIGALAVTPRERQALTDAVIEAREFGANRTWLCDWSHARAEEESLRWCLLHAQDASYAHIRGALWLWAAGQRPRAWRALEVMEAMLLDTKTA